ncbi:A/G-specific adenine glycosylase [Acaricomes phytoseiuli]|uniref:A/G-specific adenine glycosylase n=1 Tax=Acaricomes phytoseiuli TaxID=291968 RepID=UPI000367EEE6|nr:A/G-specific adenine glycosylase [Acaricomes phytoseiuli]
MTDLPDGTAHTISAAASTSITQIRQRVTDWFAREQRDLPWRHPERTAWGVLVSEVMLQQTPVVRVLPVWQQWLDRWPEPAALAADSSGEAVRAWGRLGYPRRALRLHAAATKIASDHGGIVPQSIPELRALPGIGDYTAAAVATFAFGLRSTVVDTNIRRVEARLFQGDALPAPILTAAEMRLAEELLPEDPGEAVSWNAAVMELGALVCTARSPQCSICPVSTECAWIAAGKPAPSYQPKGQPWAGTDRQLRGAVMAVLRAAEHPVPGELLHAPAVRLDQRAQPPELTRLYALDSEPSRLERILEGLVADGLAVRTEAGLALPS